MNWRGGHHWTKAMGILAIVALLAAVACGDDEDTAATTTTTTTTAAPAAAAPAAVPTAPSAAMPTGVAGAVPTAPVASAPAIQAAAVEILGVVSQRDIEEAKYGGVLRGFIYTQANSLDPVELTGPIGDDMTGGLMDRLLEWDPFDPTSAIPDLAVSWSQDSTGIVYTFKLRDGVKWHDGVPFTANDVEATFDYWFHAWNSFRKTQRVGGFLVPLVDSYRAVDGSTFEVTLKAPANQFIPILASTHYNIYPKHKLEPFIGLENFDPVYTGDGRPPIGTGPFTYKKYVPAISMEWSRNDDYWRKDSKGRDLPYLDGYKGFVIEDNTLSFAAFKTGQIDFYTPFPILTEKEARDLKDSLGDKISIVRGSALLNEGIQFNMGGWAPGAERDFRWALNLIIDRDEMNDVVFDGAIASARILDPRIWPAFSLPEAEVLTSPWVKPRTDETYAEARRLLTGLGFDPETFPPIELLARNTAFYCLEAELAALQLKRFGFKTTVDCPSSSVGSALAREGKYQLNPQANGTTVPSPIIALQQRYQLNGAASFRNWNTPTGSESPAQAKVNALIEQATSALDPTKLQGILWDVQRVLYFEDSPNIDLGWTSTVVPVYNYVRGLTTYSGLYEPQVREYTWLDK